MRSTLLLIIFFAAITSCSKKTVSEKTVASKPVIAAPTMMIVSDGSGKIYTPASKLPKEENLKPDYLQLSKGFTPQQQANLKARYNTVLPRVLYIATKSQLKSLKGVYYIYKTKFWYWKKEDGLFYLDEQYYN